MGCLCIGHPGRRTGREGRKIVNDYYEQAFTGQELGIADDEQIRASLKRIEAAFDKLPRLRALLEDRVTAVVATGGPNAFTIRLPHPPTAYTDGMAVNVRFPMANTGAVLLDMIDANGIALGAKPVRQVDGSPLQAGHLSADSRGELYYVTAGGGYWTLGAGARGIPGPPGPPAGTFSINAARELVFTPNDGSVATTIGRVAFRHRGDYAAATTYEFLDVVASGFQQYWHIGVADTTGTPVTDTTVWQPLTRLTFWYGTQAQYNALTPEDGVVYLIQET